MGGAFGKEEGVLGRGGGTGDLQGASAAALGGGVLGGRQWARPGSDGQLVWVEEGERGRGWELSQVRRPLARDSSSLIRQVCHLSWLAVCHSPWPAPAPGLLGFVWNKVGSLVCIPLRLCWWDCASPRFLPSAPIWALLDRWISCGTEVSYVKFTPLGSGRAGTRTQAG